MKKALYIIVIMILIIAFCVSAFLVARYVLEGKKQADRYEDLANIKNLKKVMYILDIVRTQIGKPILVNSGYRCKKLNEMVGGVQKSMHTKGLAADFRTERKGDIDIMFEFLKKNQKKFKIIELINYKNFIHMGVSETLTI